MIKRSVQLYPLPLLFLSVKYDVGLTPHFVMVDSTFIILINYSTQVLIVNEKKKNSFAKKSAA